VGEEEIPASAIQADGQGGFPNLLYRRSRVPDAFSGTGDRAIFRRRNTHK
jgi:hypothetical protein